MACGIRVLADPVRSPLFLIELAHDKSTLVHRNKLVRITTRRGTFSLPSSLNYFEEMRYLFCPLQMRTKQCLSFLKYHLIFKAFASVLFNPHKYLCKESQRKYCSKLTFYRGENWGQIFRKVDKTEGFYKRRRYHFYSHLQLQCYVLKEILLVTLGNCNSLTCIFI